MIYKKVFLPIDAHDNGQTVENRKFSLEIAYGYNGYGEGIKVGRVIADMNNDDVNSVKQDLRFGDAMKYAFDSLLPVISTMVKTRRQNMKMVDLLKNENLSSGVVILPKGGYVNQWILKQIDPKKQLFFTIYKKKDLPNGQEEWGFSAVQEERFVNRADLVKEDKEKYPNLIFIHKKRFCGSSRDVFEAKDICYDSVNAHKARKRKQYNKKMAVAGGLAGGLVGLYYLFLRD